MKSELYNLCNDIILNCEKKYCEGCNWGNIEYPYCLNEKITDSIITAGWHKPPCKIGDQVWAIRNYKGVMHPQKGTVGEIYFSHEMKLIIVVRHISRGQWGQSVFATREETEKAIKELEKACK